MGKIIARLPVQRENIGSISLVSNAGITIVSLSVLGKAAFDDAAQHGNPQASPLLKYGDTPLGSYSITSVTNGGSGVYSNVDAYGDTKVLVLDPLSGDALLAKANGRTGILVHGGKLGAGGKLRRTNGCLRMTNTEVKVLVEKIFDLKLQTGEDTSELTVIHEEPPSYKPGDNDDSIGEGDPPPFP